MNGAFSEQQKNDCFTGDEAQTFKVLINLKSLIIKTSHPVTNQYVQIVQSLWHFRSLSLSLSLFWPTFVNFTLQKFSRKMYSFGDTVKKTLSWNIGIDHVFNGRTAEGTGLVGETSRAFGTHTYMPTGQKKYWGTICQAHWTSLLTLIGLLSTYLCTGPVLLNFRTHSYILLEFLDSQSARPFASSQQL